MALPKIFKNIDARVKKSGDFMSGTLSIENKNNVSVFANDPQCAVIQSYPSGDWEHRRSFLLKDKDAGTLDNALSLGVLDDGSWKEYNILHGGNYNNYSPTLNGTGATGTWPITAATSTGINTYKVISFTTPSAGWYRIASVGSLSIPRGQVRFSIVGKGGSSSPLSCDIKIDTSWSDAGCNEISADGSSYHVNGCRIGHDGTNTYIEIYTPIKIQSTTNIVVPYNLADHWQNTKWNWTSGGELQASSSTTISYALTGWNSGISTSNYMTSSGFLTKIATDYSTFRARSAACGTSSAPSSMGNGEMWIRY